MKKIKLIYNPYSGDRSFKNKLDLVIEKFQNSDYTVIPFRIGSKEGFQKALDDIDNDYHAVCVSGGDGTINSVVNLMQQKSVSVPIGIFPSGTSNDFSNYLGISRDINKCCDIILKGNIKAIDAGKVNDMYFVNVCSAGLLTDVAYKTDANMKNALGKIAYYIKGIEEIPFISPLKMKMTYEGNTIEDKLYLVLVLNSSSAGGFMKLAPKASIDDGVMDVVAIKSTSIPNLLGVFLKILRGEHVYDSNIYHFQTNDLIIDCEEKCETDIDGEKGPNFPLAIKVIKKVLKVYIP